MNLILLKLKAWFLASKLAYISETLEGIETVYQREKADGDHAYAKTAMERARIRRQILLRTEAAVLLDREVVRGR